MRWKHSTPPERQVFSLEVTNNDWTDAPAIRIRGRAEALQRWRDLAKSADELARGGKPAPRGVYLYRLKRSVAWWTYLTTESGYSRIPLTAHGRAPVEYFDPDERS